MRLHLIGDKPRSIHSLVLVSFVLISLVPVLFLGSQMYQIAWQDAWREINEKHRLLALNLVPPIQIYIQDHQTMLGMMSSAIHNIDRSDIEEHRRNISLLKQSLQRSHEFQSFVIINADEETVMIVKQDGTTRFDVDAYSNAETYVNTIMTEESQISGVVFSQTNGKPTLLITSPIYDLDEQVIGVLIGELDIQVIEDLRKRVAFGEGGHSAIVDHTGRVIAHPNSQWMVEIRDISSVSIIQLAIAGETGVTEFYSPFVKEQMVAGYTGVPGLGWGIIVPQPKREIENQVNAILSTQLFWAIIGVILAIIFSFLLAKWITRPIFRLSKNAAKLIKQEYEGELPKLSKKAPVEIIELDKVLRVLIDGLQESRQEVTALNVSLQQRVDSATHQLQITVEQLSNALELTNQFVSFARHDLRKPIAVITDIVDDLLNEAKSKNLDRFKLNELLNLISKTTDYMNNIVTDFLGKEASADGRINLQNTDCNINDIVRLISRSNENYAHRKGVELIINIDKCVDDSVFDEARISQVVQNLIDNAIKFCSEGDQVTVTTYQHSDSVEVRVSDTGPGLTDQDLKVVFGKDVRLSNKPTGGEMSTGVGLVICKHIIDLHGGIIGVENNSNGGCSFWFKLGLAANVASPQTVKTV